MEESSHSSVCPWKGKAGYYSLVVDGRRNRDAAWFYAEPKSGAGHTSRTMRHICCTSGARAPDGAVFAVFGLREGLPPARKR